MTLEEDRTTGDADEAPEATETTEAPEAPEAPVKKETVVEEVSAEVSAVESCLEGVEQAVQSYLEEPKEDGHEMWVELDGSLEALESCLDDAEQAVNSYLEELEEHKEDFKKREDELRARFDELFPEGLTMKQASRLLHCNPKTLKKREKRGEIERFMGTRGDRRFKKKDVLDLLLGEG